jgi:colanic acid/amylovoran biosynthesis glycosyltransferase
MKIAYVLSRYPTLTETFIKEELLTMLLDGIELRVYPLRGPQDTVWVIEKEPDGGISECVRRFGLAISPANLGAALLEFGRSPVRFLQATRLLMRVSPVGLIGLAKALFLLPKGCRIARDIRAWGSCHVHAQFANMPGAIGAFIGHLLPTSCSFTAHAFDIYGRDRASLGHLGNAVDFVVTISEKNRQYFTSGPVPVPAAQVHVVHCGVDLQAFPATDPTQGPLLAVGRLVPKKGFDLLVRAVAELRSRNVIARCRIIGEGEQRTALAQLIADLGVGDLVELVGPLPPVEVRRELSQASAFVLPCVQAPGGDVDGIPVSLMEAMSMGRIVVTSDVSGIRELVTDGYDGIVLPQGDVKALGGAIERLISGEMDAASMGRNARATIEAGFDCRANARLLQSLIANSSDQSPTKP